MKNNRKRLRELIKVIFASHFMVIDNKNQITQDIKKYNVYFYFNE